MSLQKKSKKSAKKTTKKISKKKTTTKSSTSKTKKSSELPILVRALKGEKTERVPVWYMRQAGRYLPEYHKVRRNFDFISMCQNVDASVEVSIQPHTRFDVDGIIMFSDILTPLSGAGIRITFEEKKGPVIKDQIYTAKDVELLSKFNPVRDTGYVQNILKGLRGYIDGLEEGKRPGLLGFAGAPFTLASYLIEGGSTKLFEKTKAMLFGNPKLYHTLADRLCEMQINYLKMQLESGADAVQVFESWGGILSPADYREFAMPYTARIIKEVKKMSKSPVILFVGNSSHLLADMVKQKPNVVSLDWRISPEQARDMVPDNMAIQGNLDPLVLYGSAADVKERTKKVLKGFAKRKGGYVFNLGHGIHPQTPIENVKAMLKTVRDFKV